MNELYLWFVTAVVTIVGLHTLVRLWSRRHLFFRDDLNDEDRAFAWRIVIFLIFPLLTLSDLRATMAACTIAGGQIEDWSYGLFWYSAIPSGLSSEQVALAILFSGAAVQFLLALSLSPALFFRPHPFLSCIIGYTISFILALNLIIEPFLSFVGLGGSRWQLALPMASPGEKALLTSLYAALAVTYLVLLTNRRLRVWFAELTRPRVAEKLRRSMRDLRRHPASSSSLARVALLYDLAGMPWHARKTARKLRLVCPESIYVPFVEAMLSYGGKNFRKAEKLFLKTAEYCRTDTFLQGSLLAASGCCAFAAGDNESALNLAERALEFDESSVVARAIKVDVFLGSGKREQAGAEIVQAIRRGLDLNLENKLPLDLERTLAGIAALEEVRPVALPAGVPAAP